MIKFTALCIAPFALFIGAPLAIGHYDSQETTRTYRVADMFGGGMGVIETTTGTRLGFYSEDKTVGLYRYGEPRVVAFGCEGTDGVLIAMEEDLLPKCDRVEPIQYENKASWAN